jgi:hypothetical protein
MHYQFVSSKSKYTQQCIVVKTTVNSYKYMESNNSRKRMLS